MNTRQSFCVAMFFCAACIFVMVENSDCEAEESTLAQRVSDCAHKEQPIDILRMIAANNPMTNSSARVGELLVGDIDLPLVRIFAIRADAQAIEVHRGFSFDDSDVSKIIDWASGVDAGGTIWRVGFVPRGKDEVYAFCIAKPQYSSQFEIRGIWKLVPKHWNK